MNLFVMEVAMDCCLWMWFCTRCAWLALGVRQCLLVDGRRDHRPSEKAEANTHVELVVAKTTVTVMMQGISATIPIPYMVAGLRYPPAAPALAAPQLRVLAPTAAQCSEENKGAKSIGELEEEMKSAEFDKVKNERAETVEDRIDDGKKESTSEEHDSSTAEKKARARRAKRRA